MDIIIININDTHIIDCFDNCTIMLRFSKSNSKLILVATITLFEILICLKKSMN